MQIAKVDRCKQASAKQQATTNDNVDQEQNSGTSTITGIQPEVSARRKQLMMKSLLSEN